MDNTMNNIGKTQTVEAQDAIALTPEQMEQIEQAAQEVLDEMEQTHGDVMQLVDEEDLNKIQEEMKKIDAAAPEMAQAV